jgi:hypothetical protein
MHNQPRRAWGSHVDGGPESQDVVPARRHGNRGRVAARRLSQPLFRVGLVLSLVAASGPIAVQAQTPGSLTTTIPADALARLPSSSNLFSLLETMQPEVISDRIDTAGLSTGEAARIGAHGTSWTQTLFRIGDVDITDPDGSGVPLLVPDVFQWQRIDVATGLIPVDVNSAGVAVTLIPRRPTNRWIRTIEGSVSPAPMVAGRAIRNPPAIARLDWWTGGTLFLSGPVVPNRVGLVFASNWTDSARFERSDPDSLDANARSLFANLIFTPTPHDEVQTIAWGQRTLFPSPDRVALGQLASERDLGIHVQSAWSRTVPDGLSWRFFGGYTDRRRDPDPQAAGSVTVERLLDGPIADLPSLNVGLDQSWTIGARLSPARFEVAGRRHSATMGVDLTGALAHRTSAFSGQVGEVVAGLPARVWAFTPSRAESIWSSTSVAAFVADRFAVWPSVTLGLGLRFEMQTGSAAGAANGISWQDWFPRGDIRWEVTGMGNIAAVAGFSRYGYRLPLGWLAYGDPAAPVGNVYRWIAKSGASPPQPSQIGQLIARVGPGTGGDPSFSGIDPALRRPYADELAFGFESRPAAGATLRLMAIARREHDLVGLVDVGVPDSGYSVMTVLDPGYAPTDPQVLSVYNRSPATFGADRYLLTNPAGDEATFVGVDISAQVTTGPVFLLIGGTAGRSEGYAASRGYLASENDQGLIGELFTDPNARTHAQGRLFTERGYTLKMSGVWRLPADTAFGMAARYQDGQHFARILVVDSLNQGPEAVRAFRNGRTRFTYTLTVDAQLQKGFLFGGRRVELTAGAYNLLNTANEVEELAALAPALRETSAIQPPRAFRVGLGFGF